MEHPSTSSPEQPRGIDRRALLRRTAVTGGALAWSTPLVQTVSSPAFAAGSPLCDTRVEADDCTFTYVPTVDCCECVEEHPDLSPAEALALCARLGRCTEDRVICGEEEEKPPPNPPSTPPSSPPPDHEVRGRQATTSVPTVIPAGT